MNSKAKNVEIHPVFLLFSLVIVLLSYIILFHCLCLFSKCMKNRRKSKHIHTQTDSTNAVYTSTVYICPNKSLMSENILVNENFSEVDLESDE